MARLNEIGHQAQRVVGGHRTPGSLYWGQGGGNKFEELQRLAAAGIVVPAHSLTKQPGWLARTFNHMGAQDLTAERQYGDYYVCYVPTIREHRLHVFNGASIRVQMKVPRVENPHPRFRSHQNGWKFVSGPEYTAQVPRGARDMAKRAVSTMGYVFGAVDIGVTTDGAPIVWEVNTQPGVEGTTADAYARAIAGYYANGR